MRSTMSAVARPAKNTAWNEVFALILLGVGTLLFLALISYNPQDVPAYFWFSKVSTRALPTQNFIGPAGAIIGGFCYFMVGAASYFLAVVLLGFGAAKLFHPQLRVAKRAGWIALFIISGACLLHLQKWFLRDWPSAFNIQGPGGWVGFYFGGRFLQTVMGRVGSVILLTGVYVTSIILMTGLRPIHIVRQTVTGIRDGIRNFTEAQRARRMRTADWKTRLELEKKDKEKQQRVVEKRLKKLGAPVPEAATASVLAEELVNRPKPKVVDTTALPEEPPRKKPSLAEMRAKEKS